MTDIFHPTPADDRDDALPRSLGKYHIDRSLGRGGMGEVFLGYDATLARPVAIKVLPRELARHDDFVARFYAEASAAARVTHPHVIPIHFIGEDAGRHFFVMPYVEGESLSQRLAREVRLNVDESLSIIDDVLAGLQAAHAQRLIHRDIKPANILLDKQHSRAVVADFGLVKTLGDVGGRTATGVILGTVEYMAPEQGRGRDIDHRCDLYSTGVMFYRMLVGRLPFKAESPTGMIFQHVYERPQPLVDILPELPAALWAVIARLLAKSPDLRYPHAQAVRDDLKAVRQQRALPSGAEHADFESYWKPPGGRRHDAPESIIVTAPTFDADPAESVEPLPAVNWWRQVREIGADWWRARRPDWLSVLESTQQQIDGAVDEYQRRQQQLRSLVREADSVLAALNTQRHRVAGEANFSGLIAGQAEQLASMRVKLAQVDATLQRLRAQRDLFNARLKAARARAQIESGTTASSFWKRRATALLGVALVTCGIVAMIWWTTKSSQTDEPTAASSNNALKSLTPYLFDTEILSTPLIHTPLLAADVGLVRFTDDGSSIAVAMHSGLVEFRDAADGQLLRTVELPAGKNTQVVAGDYGNVFACLTSSAGQPSSRSMEVRSLSEPQTQITNYPIGASDTVISVEGKPPRVRTLTKSSGEGSIQTLTILGDGADTQHFSATSAEVWAFNAEGRQLALGSAKSEIEIFDLTSETAPLTPPFKLPTYAVQMAFHPRERWLAVLPAPGDKVVLWNLESREPFAELLHNGENILRFVFDSRGRRLAVASEKQIRVWDLELKHARQIVPVAKSQSLAFSADGERLAAISRNGELTSWTTAFPVVFVDLVSWWEALSEARKAELTPHRPPAMTHNSLRAVTKDGRLTLVVEGHRRPFVADAVTHERFHEFQSDTVRSVAIAPNGKLAATGGSEGDVKFWNLRSGQEIATCKGHDEHVWSVMFSPNGKLLLSAANRVLNVWDVDTRTLVQRVPIDVRGLGSALFSPDARQIVTADPKSLASYKIIYSRTTEEPIWKYYNADLGWAFAPLDHFRDQRFGQWRTLNSASLPDRSQP